MNKIINKFNAGNKKRIIGLVLFLLILINIFSTVTYLFRNHTLRDHIVGIKEEEPLDMIYIGGSAAFVYWQPLKAWKDCGFTSYDLAVNSIQAESIKYHIKHALKYQKPKLFVIGVRAFQYYSPESAGGDLRNTADCLDLGLDRIKLIHEYWENRTAIEGKTDEKLSFYFDIMKWHTNYGLLADPEQYKMADNSCDTIKKGYEWGPLYQYENKSINFQTEFRGTLYKKSKEILCDLLEFCKKEDLEVLFVVAPYQINRKEYAQYNTIEDIVSSYGYNFLDTNDYYDEMGIDFSTDFYNANHVNCFGAEKYTEFLEHYISEHYHMPDHRKDKRYASWYDDYKHFSDEGEEIKSATLELILTAQDGKKIAGQIPEKNDFSEWANLVGDSRFTILVTGDGTMSELYSATDKKAFSRLGLDQSDQSNYIRVIKGEEILYSNAENPKEDKYKAIVGVDDAKHSRCCIKNNDGVQSIRIDGKEYCKKGKGMNIVVFENDYRYVVDSVNIRYDEDGNIIIKR